MVEKVPDTEENLEICKKNCGPCPTFKPNDLQEVEPGALFTTVGALGILATSDILLLSQFGYITAIAIVFSFIASVFILPSALMLWARWVK